MSVTLATLSLIPINRRESYCSESHLKTDECLPFIFGFVEGIGRVVTAAHDIKAGEAVITEHPLVKGPGNKTFLSLMLTEVGE